MCYDAYWSPQGQVSGEHSMYMSLFKHCFPHPSVSAEVPDARMSDKVLQTQMCSSCSAEG